MTDIYIIYGSETKLLKNIYSKKNAFFIRIYNQKKPSYLTNSFDTNSYEIFCLKFEEIIKLKKTKRIIFIGAAFIFQNALFVSEKFSDIQSMINTNISNYLKFVHFLIPHMIKLKSGNLIFLSSFITQATTKGVSIYAASKSFCETFFEVLGKEYGSFGVYSNSIRLGCFNGEMFNILSKEKQKKLLLSIGNRRLGTSRDLIKAIDFILD